MYTYHALVHAMVHRLAAFHIHCSSITRSASGVVRFRGCTRGEVSAP